MVGKADGISLPGTTLTSFFGQEERASPGSQDPVWTKHGIGPVQVPPKKDTGPTLKNLTV